MLQFFRDERSGVIRVHGVSFVLVVVGCGTLELEVCELGFVLFDELWVYLDDGVYWLLVGEGLVEVADVLRGVHLRNVLWGYLHIRVSYLHAV